MFRLDVDRAARGRVLCLGAHCDDIEIGCGGTILKWIAQFPHLTWRWAIFCSNPARADEARASARELLHGARASQVTVDTFGDGFLPFRGAEVKERFEALKREIEPDLIFTHYRDDRHQDHRLLSDLTWNTFRNHLILEYEIPKYDGDLGHPNVFVELDEETVRRKVAHLMAHFPSQRSRQWYTEDAFAAALRLRGIESGADAKYAEAFHGRKLRL